VRWSPLFIGALGCVAACAAILGIEAPVERIETDGAATPPGDAPASTPDDAPTSVEDASGPDVEADAGADRTGTGPVIGVVCGEVTCTGGLGCCFSTPSGPQHCTARNDCALFNGAGFAGCDGPEDCDGKPCCGTAAPGGAGFSTNCMMMATACPTTGFAVCHPGAAPCALDCIRGSNACLPLTTCSGACN
jgi:hypothetical protein